MNKKFERFYKKNIKIIRLFMGFLFFFIVTMVYIIRYIFGFQTIITALAIFLALSYIAGVLIEKISAWLE